MNKRIVQILHNLIGKGKKPDGKTDGNEIDSGTFHAADSVMSGIDARDVSVMRAVDQRSFEKTVNESLKGRGHGCLLVCDVDRCREINDIYGRDTGELVLWHVVSVLCAVFGECACIGSLGSDAFALWLPAMSRDGVDDIRRRIGAANDRLLHPTGELVPVTISAGAAFYEPGDDYKSLEKKANKALYRVKENGRCGCEMSL